MDTRRCDHLDDYLAGVLSAAEAARFEAHLAECPACREEVADGQRIDRLLARASDHLEPVPARLVDRIEGRIGSLRRRRLVRVVLGLSAAAAALLAVGISLMPRDEVTPPRPATHRDVPFIAEETIKRKPDSHADVHEAPPPAQLPSNNARRVRVSLADPAEAILVPIETSNPNVSIVWIYPTLRPGRAAAQPGAVSP